MKLKVNEVLGFYTVIIMNAQNLGVSKSDIENYLNAELDETDIIKAFGAALKTMREIEKESLNTLSKEIDIPNPTINRYENGINAPTIPQIVKIVAHFKIPFEMFVFLGVLKLQGHDIESWYKTCRRELENAKQQNRAQRRATKH